MISKTMTQTGNGRWKDSAEKGSAMGSTPDSDSKDPRRSDTFESASIADPDSSNADSPVTGWWWFLGAAAGAVLLLDQLTKTWAVRKLAWPPLGDGEVIELVGSLRLRYAENTGMAFSRGSGAGPWIALLAVGISIVLVVFASKATSRTQVILMGVVIGGALGNILDRAFRGNSSGEGGLMSGAVVDFVDVGWWPVFNVADAAIVCGGIALVLFGLREPSGKSHGESPGEDQGEPEIDPTRA